jgi:polyisoprenoid-binding protein YceI
MKTKIKILGGIMYSYMLKSVLVIISLIGIAFSADTYQFDTAHTNIGFVVKHMVITNVKGNFTEYSGTIVLDENDLSKSSIDVIINTASINTNNQRRDDHLRSGDFFLADEYPNISFKSKNISTSGDGYLARGILTMRGISKEIELPFKIIGKITDTRGNIRMGIESELTINRQDYGISWSKTLDTGGLVVSDEVKIELDLELIKKNS